MRSAALVVLCIAAMGPPCAMACPLGILLACVLESPEVGIPAHCWLCCASLRPLSTNFPLCAGRAGRSGEAITFFAESDAGQLRAVANTIRAAGCEVPDWMLQLKKERQKKNKKRQRSGDTGEAQQLPTGNTQQPGPAGSGGGKRRRQQQNQAPDIALDSDGDEDELQLGGNGKAAGGKCKAPLKAAALRKPAAAAPKQRRKEASKSSR